MKLFFSIVIPIIIFFIIGNFLDYFTQMSGDENLFFAGVSGFITFVISLYVLNTWKSIMDTSLVALGVAKGLIETAIVRRHGKHYWWSLWLPYFVIAFGWCISYILISNSSSQNIKLFSFIVLIITLLFSIFASIIDRKRRKELNLGYTKLAIVPAILFSIVLVFFIIFVSIIIFVPDAFRYSGIIISTQFSNV